MMERRPKDDSESEIRRYFVPTKEETEGIPVLVFQTFNFD